MNDYKNMNNDYVLRRTRIQSSDQSKPTNDVNKLNRNGISFDQVLNGIQNSEEVKFSKHAISRLQSRNIDLSTSELERLNSAVDKAGAKGITDALILMDNKAFVASIKNNMIITAATDNELKDNVFTNIDGAVIV